MRQEEAVLHAMLGIWQRLLGIQNSLDMERGSGQQRKTARIVLADSKVQEGRTELGAEAKQEEESVRSSDGAEPFAPRVTKPVREPAIQHRERRRHHTIQFYLHGPNLDDDVADATATESRMAPNGLPHPRRHLGPAQQASPAPLAAADPGVCVSDRTRV